MFGEMKLRGKIMLSVCSVALIAFAFIVTFVALKSHDMAKEAALTQGEELAYRYAAEVKGQVDVAMDAARALAQIFEALKADTEVADRAVFDTMLKKLVASNPTFLGVWTCWEPNALDGKDDLYANKPGHDATGRYIPYWYRGSSGIALDALVDYDKPGAGDYYLLAQKSGREVILDPYPYNIDGKEVLLTSLVVPIKVKGQVLGVAGVDFSLDTFVEMVSGIHPFETGNASLIANNGTYVAHQDKERSGKGVGESADWQASKQKITAGEFFEIENFSQLLDTDVQRIFVPVKFGMTDTPWSFLVNLPMNKVLAEARSMRNTSILIGLIAFAIFTAIALLLANSLSKPIQKAADMLKDIAQGEGDLTKRLEISSKDEVGEMASWFNAFIGNLQEVVKKLSTSSQSVGASSSQLLGIASELSQSATESSQRTLTVSTASEEMATAMVSVAASMEESSTNTEMVASAAEEMTATINEIAQNSEKARSISDRAVRQARETSENMDELGRAAADIGKVTEAITEISEQTNLLALNATIEAARAGEAGKGFAVVANEIKELAKQTAGATQDIKAKIGSVQSTTDASVSQINEITTVIQSINEIVSTIATAVEEQSTVTSEIANNITQASQGIQNVNENLNQSSTVANEINQEIADVSNANEGISSGSDQVKLSAENLQQMAAELNTIVSRFRV